MILDQYDGGRVRLVYEAEAAIPYAVYVNAYGKPRYFHAMTTARQFYEVHARPIPVPYQPVCEGCEMVFRRDVPDPVWGDRLTAPRCPCCGTFTYTATLADLPKIAQQTHNRNTMRFFHNRMRSRLFKGQN